MLLEELRWGWGAAPHALHCTALHPWEAQALLPCLTEWGPRCQQALIRSAPGAAGVCTAAGAHLELISTDLLHAPALQCRTPSICLLPLTLQ